MTDDWFRCRGCDVEFREPEAPEGPGPTVHGQCPSCGETVSREPEAGS